MLQSLKKWKEKEHNAKQMFVCLNGAGRVEKSLIWYN